MNQKSLADLIALGEGFTTEFKKAGTSNLGREICAFANATGGGKPYRCQTYTIDKIGFSGGFSGNIFRGKDFGWKDFQASASEGY
jgi:hypothetical protein